MRSFSSREWTAGSTVEHMGKRRQPYHYIPRPTPCRCALCNRIVPRATKQPAFCAECGWAEERQ